jgi:TPR repeat protein
MYADGDGVAQNELRAFQYFRRFADTYADENPEIPRSRLVANAFVALGHYYLEGIPNSSVKADTDRAREMYAYAASYFRDPDAQYYLARVYLDGAARDARQAVRWLVLAANKGQCQAQGLLGRILYNGEDVPRQASRGLMWLTLARDCIGVGGTGEKADWVIAFHDAASSKASEEERAQALALIDRWMRSRRD